MKSDFLQLKAEFKRILNRFRMELLLSDLLRGAAVLFFFFMLYLLFYYFVINVSPLTVSFKTILYTVFLIAFIALFVFYILRPLLFFILAGNWEKKKLLGRILGYLPETGDLLNSLYALAFKGKEVTGDQQLKEAAFIQKFSYLEERGIVIRYPLKKLMMEVLMMVVLVGIFFANGSNFNRLYQDLLQYEEVHNPKFDVGFVLLNKSLNVEYGKPLKLELKVESEFLSIENVFICFGGGEFLMDKQDSVYVYDFDVINNDIKFNFRTSGVESRYFKINVLPTPEITDYEVTLTPPAYTGLKSDILKNVVDFRALYGSVLKFEVDFSNVDSLFLESPRGMIPVSLRSGSHTAFSSRVAESGEYALYGSNKNFTRKNLINFSVTCIPDLYPGIQVSEIQDSLRNSLYYFYGIITDDYGFSDLRFNYSLNGKTNTVMPVNIVKNINSQEFYFEFDFAEFGGMDKTKISYFFEVFDNDVVSGPKSTRSDAKTYTIPDLNAVFDYNLQANNTVNNALNEAEKLAKDIVSGVKELQKKLLDSSSDNWEKQQLAKDISDKKEKLDKLLNEVKTSNQKKSSFNNSFTKQDSILQLKQEQIQQLLDKIMDEDMKKLMEEFSGLSKEFNKDKFQQLDEKMKLGFDQMSEELDRNIELLKRYQIEEKHHIVSQQLEQLKKEQQEFNRLNNDKSVSKDSLSSSARDVKDKLLDVKENYNDLIKENKQLEAPYDLKDKNDKFDNLSQMLDKQEENASKGRKDDKLSKDIEKEVDEVSEELEEQQQKNFMEKALPKNDIELIIQNILLISLSQEELINRFSGVSPQSPVYTELGRIQELKRAEYKIVKDSLSVLAKSNLMLASILSGKFYDIEVKFGLLPDYIQNNKPGDLKREQQYIVTYLNDIALSLSEAMQKQEEGEEGSGSGSGSKSKDKGSKKKGGKGGDKPDRYGEMKKIQNGLKRQLEDLISQMKSGAQGQPLQEGISKMIRENELFRKSLNDFMSGESAMSNTERQLLNEINKLLDDNIRDLSNYSVTNNLMMRNNQVYNKLLLSEKASREREEYEEKRKSVTASDKKFERPEMHFNTEKKSAAIKTDLQRSDLKLNPFFKNMYNNYYIRLGDE